MLFSLGTVSPGQTVSRSGNLVLGEPEPLLPAGEIVRFEVLVSDSVNREAVATRSLPEPGIGLGSIVGLLALRALRGRRGRDFD